MIGKTVKKVLNAVGFEINRVPRSGRPAPVVVPAFEKIHYACGYTILPDWLNVDIMRTGPENYLYANLVARHPFPDESFRFALCEDFIEHVDQADSLIFFAEVHRTLKRGGVLRLTFPCLERVLTRHYPSTDFQTAELAREQVFSRLGHVHYYCRESLGLVARHIGFDFAIVECGRSLHAELRDINTRTDEVNLHAELTKR